MVFSLTGISTSVFDMNMSDTSLILAARYFNNFDDQSV